MRFHVVTIFPDILDSYIHESLFKRAEKNKIVLPLDQAEEILKASRLEWQREQERTIKNRNLTGEVTSVADMDAVLDMQISNDDPEVDQVLRDMQAQYGDQLKGLSEREVYNLFKQHSLFGTPK